jgi:hypothetical protein
LVRYKDWSLSGKVRNYGVENMEGSKKVEKGKNKATGKIKTEEEKIEHEVEKAERELEKLEREVVKVEKKLSQREQRKQARAEKARKRHEERAGATYIASEVYKEEKREREYQDRELRRNDPEAFKEKKEREKLEKVEAKREEQQRKQRQSWYNVRVPATEPPACVELAVIKRRSTIRYGLRIHPAAVKQFIKD